MIVCYLFVVGKYVVVLYVKARRPLYSLADENRQVREKEIEKSLERKLTDFCSKKKRNRFKRMKIVPK